MTRLSIQDAEARVAQAFTAANVSEATAASVARALVAAEIDGQGGHGLSRISSYAAQARSGKVDGHAAPDAAAAGPSYLTIDGAHGFAYPAIDLAIERLIPLAEAQGLAGASIIRSHHAGQLGAHVERLAEAGLVAFMVANTPSAMTPWGGDTPIFGTNPIAFAAPGEPPLVIDLSLSKVARGKVMAASKAGEAIPEGWALDAAGQPTTDPQAALKGSMVPAGDAKGAALALMVEVLAATLAGANPSAQASSFFDAEGTPPGVGQFILAIRPGEGFAERMTALAASIDAQSGARLPGAGRIAKRAAAARDGVAVPAHLAEALGL